MTPKCRISITFEREDGVYTAGDTVRGEVRARVLETFTCRAYVISTFWRTHGKGNRATGDEKILHTVQAPSWREGDEIVHEFSFVAPGDPVTYRGHFINIDYYVQAKLDLPWALDQTEDAEFIVHPGTRDLTRRRVQKRQGGDVSRARSVGWTVFAVIALISWALFGRWVAIAIGIAGAALIYAKPLRRRVAESGLGRVAIKLASTRIVQGEAVPLSIGFEPLRSLTLNGVTAKLSAREVCYSGSGSNRQRHRHVVFERLITLADAGVVRAGEAQSFNTAFEIPTDKGFTFKARDNEIRWRLDCRIDVAGWPDRVETIKLDVLPGRAAPGTELQADVAGGPGWRARIGPAMSPSAAPGPDVPEGGHRPTTPRQPPRAPDVPAAAAVSAGPSPSSMAEVLDAVARTDRFSDARAKAIEYLADRPFEFDVEVGRVNATFSFDVPESFRNGRTVEGEIEGGTEVLLRFPAEHNELLDQVAIRDRIGVSAVLIRWDDFRDRAEFEVAWWEGGG